MEQHARCGARNDGASHFAVSCSCTLMTRLSALSAQMEEALVGIAGYYGRQKLPPYQYEPKAWSDVRAALLAASDFRRTHGMASDDSDLGNPSQTPSGIAEE